MKILLIHPHDIYSVDEPWTSRIRNVAKELSHKGHEVKLVYFPLPSTEKNSNSDTKKLEGVETIPLNRNKWAIIKNISKVYTLSKWADIVHFQKCFAYASLPAIFGAYFANKHLHYDWDDWEYMIYRASGPSKLVGFYINVLEIIIPRMVDTISVASDYLKVLAQQRGVPEEKIFESHVCADLRVFKPKNPRRVKKKYHIRFPLVLYQGQLQGAQYAYLFIESAKIVQQEISDVKFMIVGGGYNLPKLKELAKSLGLERNIIFTDFVLHEEVPDYISVADVVVACFEENDLTKCKSPLKIVEYMA
ncbi:MAG: glycosyltransferase, partial [Candidatus Omnitrophota bacterium]|nr:glycosyltransferase [Candidatus Omnitrophota bacterium]